MRTVKRTHLKVFMFISLCLASMRTKSAYALGSVALAPLGLGLSTGTGRGCDLEPLNTLNPGSWSWPAQLQRGDKVRLGGFQLLSKATWAALPSPRHSSPLSQACLAVGAPPPPPLVLEWGRLRPHPMEDVAKTVHTHAHKCVNGLGSRGSLPHSSLSPGSGKPQSGVLMHLLSCTHSHLAGTCMSLCSPDCT